MSRRSSAYSGFANATVHRATADSGVRGRIYEAAGCLEGIEADDLPADMRGEFEEIMGLLRQHDTISKTIDQAEPSKLSGIADKILCMFLHMYRRKDEFD